MARDRLEGLLSPRLRFLLGACVLVLFVLQRELTLQLAEVALFGLLATAAGKRIRWLYFVILTLSITAFNLLTPWGQVILEWGPLRITEGALRTGLSKGLTVVGLVFVSLFTVSPGLKLPGRFGAFLSKSLLYFERLYGQRRRVRRDRLVQDIDAILEDTLSEGTEKPGPAAGAPVRAATLPGLLFAAGLLAGLTAALFVPEGWLPF